MSESPAAKFHFASDNTSGICPEAWQALEEANAGFHPSYGDDEITRQACETFRAFFETDCDVYFVFNGTAANSLALATLCQSYHSVIAADVSHCETDECGAPEFFSNGSKLLLAKTCQGKMDPADVERLVTSRSDLHFPKPRGLTLSQSTELGTVYRTDELHALTGAARKHGLRVHMDGARFFNALVSSNVAPADITWRAGVDVLSCGGTKLGMVATEAVVFFDRALGEEFAWRCKQAGQLCSKMRFSSAQWRRMLCDDVWRQYASHGNAMAKRLAAGLAGIPGVEILYPVECNAVFAKLPEPIKESLKACGWRFYSFIGGGSRFMCSWKITDEDVDSLVADAACSISKRGWP